jgi:hypothetical protein
MFLILVFKGVISGVELPLLAAVHSGTPERYLPHSSFQDLIQLGYKTGR